MWGHISILGKLFLKKRKKVCDKIFHFQKIVSPLGGMSFPWFFSFIFRGWNLPDEWHFPTRNLPPECPSLFLSRTSDLLPFAGWLRRCVAAQRIWCNHGASHHDSQASHLFYSLFLQYYVFVLLLFLQLEGTKKKQVDSCVAAIGRAVR